MKVLVVLTALVAYCSATPGFAYSTVGAPWGYYGGAYAPWAHGWVGSPLVAHRAAVIPATVAHAHALVPAVAPATLKSQYHAQNELGQASYGHVEPFQAHHAVQDAHGNKVGSYSYLNPHDGQIHRTDYVADALGYRVAANDLPLAPAVHPVAPLPAAPLPVADTPEVAAAKAAHLAEHAAASARTRRSVLLAHTPAATAPLLHAPLAYAPAPILHHAPLAYSAPLVHAPVAYAAAPALREATLTTIVNNPGHAVSYRVD